MKKTFLIIIAILLLFGAVSFKNPAYKARAWDNIIFRVSVNNSNTVSNVTGGKFRVTNNRTGEYRDFTLIPNTPDSDIYYEGTVPGSSSLREGDTVTVRELSPAPGYISDHYTSLSARVNSSGVLIIYNHPTRADEPHRFRFNNWYYYTIYSKDKDGKALPGAVFEITVPESSSSVHRSENGVLEYPVVRDGKNPGTYSVFEKTPPYGYKSSTTQRTKTFYFNRPGAGTDVFYLSPTNGVWENEPHIIRIIKKDEEGNRLSGAEFRITGSGEGGTVQNVTHTTNSSGEATQSLAGWRNGTYTITEEHPPAGYKLSEQVSQTFKLDGNTLSQSEFVFTNEPHVVIIRKTSPDEEILRGAKFMVSMECIHSNPVIEDAESVNEDEDDDEADEDDDEEAVQVCEQCDFEPFEVTAENGTYDLYLSNWRDGRYIITETVAPDGYALSSEPQYIELSGDDISTDVLVFTNIPLEIEVINVEAEDPGDLTMILPGATFEITGGEENRKVIAGSGMFTQVLGGWSSGTYTIRQIIPPAGYTLDTEAQEFTLNGDGTVTPERLIFRNTPLELTILKVCAVSGDALDGAEFRITKKDGGQNGRNDEEYIATPSGLNSSVLTATDGEVKQILAGWDNGTYVVTETIPPKGYACDTEPKEFTITGDGTMTPEVLMFYNQPLELYIEKVCADSMQVLTTTEFNIKGMNVDIDVVAEDGVFALNLAGWEDGKYVITEIVPPEGYLLDSDPQEFELVLGAVTTNKMVFTNHAEYFPDDIPQTGGDNILNWIIPLMVIISIGAAVLQMRIARKRRGDRQ